MQYKKDAMADIMPLQAKQPPTSFYYYRIVGTNKLYLFDRLFIDPIECRMVTQLL